MSNKIQKNLLVCLDNFILNSASAITMLIALIIIKEQMYSAGIFLILGALILSPPVRYRINTYLPDKLINLDLLATVAND